MDPQTVTVQQALHQIGKSFPTVIQADVEIMLAAALSQELGRKFTRSDLYLKIGDRVSEETILRAMQWAQDRAAGKTLQYLMGFQEFLGKDYVVTPGVLVPRPETEWLVTLACRRLRDNRVSPQLGLEMGLGSGAISVELLTQFSELKMRGSEISQIAIQITLKNAKQILGEIGSCRLEVVQACDRFDCWSPFEAVRGKADFLISNPPYLTERDEIAQDVLENEPWEALFAPKGEPLYFYQKISESAAQFLKPGGWVFVEIPHERSREVQELFQEKQWSREVIQDLTSRDRVLIARLYG